MGGEWGGPLTSGLPLPVLLLSIRRYVLGLPAMQRLQEGKVLLSGLQGLGAEVAKNLVLMGVGSLTLHDPHPACWSDLAAQVRALGGCGSTEQGGDRAQEVSPCSCWTGSLFSFSSRSRTWEGTGLKQLKNLWPSSTELSRSASTQATSQSNCCRTSRFPLTPTYQASPVPSSTLGRGVGGEVALALLTLRSTQAVVLTASSLEEQLKVGTLCHKHGVCFLVADTRGLVG